MKKCYLAHRLRESGSQVFVTAITRDQLNQMQWRDRSDDCLFTVKKGEIQPL